MVRADTRVDPIAELERTHLWILGLGMNDRNGLFGPALRVPLALGECECPGDCRHDHENE